jgi:predicted ATP-grasp superfamily ATP-dependent carboligase
VTRSLGRRGIPVTIADERRTSMAGASRHCRGSIQVPSPAVATEGFVARIHDEVCRGGHQVIIPTEDITLSVLAGARSRFEGMAALPFPDLETIRLAHDKSVVMSLAEDKGIPIPHTILVRDPEDVDRAARRIGFPAVVKPRLSRVRRGGQWFNGGHTCYVHTVAELEGACRAVHEAVPFPLVQEYISGEGRGVFLLLNHGEVRAAFAHRRLLEKPPSGGVSVLSESVALDPTLLGYAERLLRALKWHGVAMVEFKRNTCDGTYKLLEINGRFWGSLQLAVDAGIDFPYLLYRLAVEGDVDPVFTYREGVRLRWGLGSLDWLLLRLRAERRFVTRLRAVREYLSASGNATRAEVFRWNDPGPGLEEISQYVGQIVRGIIKRIP